MVYNGKKERKKLCTFKALPSVMSKKMTCQNNIGYQKSFRRPIPISDILNSTYLFAVKYEEKNFFHIQHLVF